MTTVRLSAVIITFNEEHNIERCIRSLSGVADEIVVVDSFSQDATERICRSLNVKFIQHSFEGHIQQKNYALAQATNDYVLSLDADEALSENLREAILRIKANWTTDAYAVNRLNNYCGKFIHHGGWYPDRRIRLWDRRKGVWGGENPHDIVVMHKNATVSRIHGDLLHFTYRDLSEHLRQMEKFASISAAEAFKKNRKTSVILHLMLYPPFVFFKTYIIRLGFLDGYEGFLVAANGAYYRFLKYAKLKALHRSAPK